MATCAVQVDSLTQFTADVLRFTAAETKYFEFLGRSSGGGGHVIATTDATDATVVSNGITTTAAAAAPTANGGFSALSKQVAQAREQIASALKNKPCDSKSSSSSGGVAPEDEMALREENIRLRKQLEELQGQVKLLTDRVGNLEIKVSTGGSPAGAGDAKKQAPAPPKDDDDDCDLFGSDDEEDEAAAKIKEQRLAEYAAKKSNKPKLIAKSNVILDVKPWDDETDMKELEKCVRSIVMDGLLWGVSKLVPVGYGINKLQIASVVEDDKVSIDELSDKITEFEDFVQSVDIAAFNKI